MKKYIILSLFIHIGIGAVLINWSGLSISEWTQDLLNNFSADQTIDEPVEIQEEPFKKVRVKKKKEINKIVTQKPEKTQAPISQKPKVQPAPVLDKTSESTIESSSTEQNPKETSDTKDTSEEIAQTEEIDTPDMNQNAEPEVKYNPAEDLTAIQQENTEAPSKNPEPTNNEQEENLSESAETTSEPIDDDSESVANRNFEEINTDPQDLKNIIKEDIPKEVKSSQTLVPVPGNPAWVYPQQAQNNKNEGSVFLQYFVDDTGFVDRIKLLKSSGYSTLDNEALRIMARQRYQPGQSGWYRHRVDFKLKNM